MLEKILIIALSVAAIHGTMYEGMIFGKVQTWFANLHENIKKPLFDCVFCQTPWWGSAIYWIWFGDSWKEWGIIILAAMGINFILSLIIDNLVNGFS